MTGPLSGLMVVDISDRLSGAFAARLFADHGAEVVLAESPTGHPLRREPPFLGDRVGADSSLVHAYANWGKSSVVVSTPDELADLVFGADVVVSNGSRIVANPTSVHLSITSHGLDGPLSEVPGNHLTACARTGWALLGAFVDEPPVPLPQDITGYLAGILGFAVAAACVLDRERSGRGDVIDLSELEVLALTTAPWAIAAVFRGEDTDGSLGGRPRRGRPGPLYEAAGGRICLSFLEWRDWPEAMRLLNLPELANDPALVPAFGRVQQDLSRVREGAARTVAALDPWTLFRTLGGMHCGSGCVQDMADLLVDEQFAARRFLIDTSIAGRPVRAPGPLTRMDGWRPAGSAPRLGTAQVAPPRARGVVESPGDVDLAGPLHGVRVLAFTQAWSGTLGTELLALLGADVVQIELLQRSDVWRNATAGIPAAVADQARRQLPQNSQGLYNSVNLNKRAIALDMSNRRGRELFWRMVPKFDIVAENFAPHVMVGWGITLESLAAARPGIVFGSLSGYGQGGPYTPFPANGSTIEPMSGLSSLHGYPGEDGMNTGGLLPDPTAGMVFAAALIAALHAGRRSGNAQRVDVAMTEAMAITLGDAVMQAAAGDGVRGPAGHRHRRLAPHGCYPTADRRWVALAAETEQMWRAIAALAGLEDDARFETLPGRKAHEDDLDAGIAAWTATSDATVIVGQLVAAGVTAAPVARVTDLIRDPEPQMLERGFLAPVTHPETGTTLMAGRPWRLLGRDPPPLRPAPCVGEHSRAVLCAELGLSEDQYNELVAAGITGTL